MPKTRSFVTLLLSATVGVAGFNLVNHNLRAADDTRQQRMDQDKWTNADFARDAVDHLKKAEQEMHRVAESDNSKVAKDAAKLCVDARSKVDEYLKLLDDQKHKEAQALIQQDHPSGPNSAPIPHYAELGPLYFINPAKGCLATKCKCNKCNTTPFNRLSDREVLAIL